MNALLDECRGQILGIVAFGNPATAPRDVPFMPVDLPVVGAESAYEIWIGNAPVHVEREDVIVSACDAQVLFGCLEIPEDSAANYSALIYDVYCRIFDHLDQRGYPNLLRIWHYLPDIHRPEQARERYQLFSVGRHEAFIARGRVISADAPAASAVGKRAGNTMICFSAATQAGTPIENPRQVSAFAYPAQYGPRGPTFARALFAKASRQSQLYISGTAAIVGHASQHDGDVAAQTDETISNLLAVMQEARRRGAPDVAGAYLGLDFKVYVREPGFRTIVLGRLRQAFGDQPSILVLHADICRRELLLEIEAVCTAATPTP